MSSVSRLTVLRSATSWSSDGPLDYSSMPNDRESPLVVREYSTHAVCLLSRHTNSSESSSENLLGGWIAFWLLATLRRLHLNLRHPVLFPNPGTRES
jgi:hypothetical protein